MTHNLERTPTWSQMIAVLSSDEVTSIFPLVENAQQLTGDKWPFKTLTTCNDLAVNKINYIVSTTLNNKLQCFHNTLKYTQLSNKNVRHFLTNNKKKLTWRYEQP